MLKLNLQYFAEDDANQNGDNQDDNNQNRNHDTNADSKNTENMIPYSRFKEINDSYKTVKQQLDDLLKKQQDAETEAKQKQGEFESLYNDLRSKHEPLTEQFKTYQETFKSILTNKLAQVPDEFKDLIPSGNEIEQLTWIENAQAKGLFKKENVQSFGNNGDNPNSGSEDQQKKGFLKSLSRF